MLAWLGACAAMLLFAGLFLAQGGLSPWAGAPSLRQQVIAPAAVPSQLRLGQAAGDLAGPFDDGIVAAAPGQPSLAQRFAGTTRPLDGPPIPGRGVAPIVGGSRPGAVGSPPGGATAPTPAAQSPTTPRVDPVAPTGTGSRPGAAFEPSPGRPTTGTGAGGGPVPPVGHSTPARPGPDAPRTVGSVLNAAVGATQAAGTTVSDATQTAGAAVNSLTQSADTAVNDGAQSASRTVSGITHAAGGVITGAASAVTGRLGSPPAG